MKLMGHHVSFAAYFGKGGVAPVACAFSWHGVDNWSLGNPNQRDLGIMPFHGVVLSNPWVATNVVFLRSPLTMNRKTTNKTKEHASNSEDLEAQVLLGSECLRL